MKLRFLASLVCLFGITLVFSCLVDENPQKETSFVTLPATEVTFEEGILNGALNDGTKSIKDCGFVYSTLPLPALGTAEEKHFGKKDRSQSLTFELEGLNSNTTYYFRTFLTLKSGTEYGEELSFTTNEHGELRAKPAENISFTEAGLPGELIPNDDIIIECGFVWNTSADVLSSGAQQKNFGALSDEQTVRYTLTGLVTNTTYYYTTFITTASGTVYDDEVQSFTTLPEVGWDTPAAFPGQARMGGVTFLVGSNVYFGLGHGFDEQENILMLGDFWKLDLLTNSWTRLEDFPGGPRSHAFSFSVWGKGYVGTGGNKTGGLQDLWEFDPISNQWIQKADHPAGKLGVAAAFSLGNKGYVGTGQKDGSGDFVKLFYEYDPFADRWSKKADYPGAAVDMAVGFAIGDYGYIGLGLLHNVGYTQQLYAYNPVTDIWTRKQDCPIENGIEGGIAFVINNKAYIGLGWGQNHIWSYDPVAGDWDLDGEIGSWRIHAVAFTAGSKAFIGTGGTGVGFYNNFIDYNPQ